MSTVLPKTRVAATRINPKILLLYSLPKVGKTSSLATLDDCLILDCEGGADMYNALRVPINSIKDIDNLIAAIIADGTANGGKYPYKYLAVDTIDKLEDYCIASATAKFKKTVIGGNFTGDSVLDLPKGGGYYHVRNEVMLQIERLTRVCPNLILTSHVKEKLLDKGGVEVTSRDISLSGKLSQIVCAAADAIGYMYRDNNDLMVNFETYEGAIMGARFPHLAGKKFKFDWNSIYLTKEISA
jgi:hypothetical protein